MKLENIMNILKSSGNTPAKTSNVCLLAANYLVFEGSPTLISYVKELNYKRFIESYREGVKYSISKGDFYFKVDESFRMTTNQDLTDIPFSEETFYGMKFILSGHRVLSKKFIEGMPLRLAWKIKHIGENVSFPTEILWHLTKRELEILSNLSYSYNIEELVGIIIGQQFKLPNETNIINYTSYSAIYLESIDQYLLVDKKQMNTLSNYNLDNIRYCTVLNDVMIENEYVPYILGKWQKSGNRLDLRNM